MPPIRLVLSPSPRALLEAAARALIEWRPSAAAGPLASPDTLLVLRQGGLRDDLHRLAGERGCPGWFDRPALTFTEFVRLLGEDRAPLGEIARRLLLRRLVRETMPQLLSRAGDPGGLARAAGRWLEPLAAERVPPEAVERALAALAPDDEWEERRNLELASLYRRFVEELARLGKRDGRDRYGAAAAAVRALEPEALRERLRGRRHLHVLGLADLRSGWRALLEALAASTGLETIALYALEPASALAALAPEVERLAAPDERPAPLSPVRAPPFPRTVRAPDVRREMEAAARSIRALLEAGTPAHRVALVSREARPHLDLAVAALERAGVPAAARLRRPLRSVPILAALRRLLTAAGEGWTRRGLVELAESPFFQNTLDPDVLNAIGYRRRVEGLDAWAAALERAAGPAAAAAAAGSPVEGAPEREEPGPPHLDPERVGRARRGFAAFRAYADVLGGTMPRGRWIEWLRDFLAADPWGVRRRALEIGEVDLEAARWDMAALRLLLGDAWASGGLLGAWAEAVQAAGAGSERLTATIFAADLEEALEGDIALATPCRRGVQVLEAFAAAYRHFDHVFLVGLDDGRFPLPPPRSPWFGAEETNALARAGLPLERDDEWDERERELFGVLLAAAGRTLTLSTSATDEHGRERIHSVFLAGYPERAVIPFSAVYDRDEVWRRLSPQAVRGARHAARIERDRRLGAETPWTGFVRAPDLAEQIGRRFGESYQWSASQLESYAKCPWAYFSARLLALEKLEEPDDAVDPTVRGVVLHEALRLLYDRLGAERGTPLMLRETVREAALGAARAALEAALDAAGAGRAAGAAGAAAFTEPDEWLGHPVLRAGARAELARTLESYLLWEIGWNEKLFGARGAGRRTLRTGVVRHEVLLGGVLLERGGVALRLRGRADRVEEAMDERTPEARHVAAVDYKSSRAGVPGRGEKAAWEDGVVLQAPLYAFSLREVTGREVSRVEYRILRASQHDAVGLSLVEVDPATQALVAPAADRARYEQALDRAAGFVAAVRRGDFPVRPAPSCGCPPFCHARQICRIPGGPVEAR